MLDLFSNNTDIGKRTAAHGIAKIAIKMNPSLAFSGQKALGENLKRHRNVQ